MNSHILNKRIADVEKRIDNTIKAVLDRGYDDIFEDCDDYSLEIDKYEFRNLIIFQLYEGYFPPKRHEFELQIIKDIVETIANNKIVIYVAIAAATGLVGNTAYDVVKKLINHVILKFKNDKKRTAPFREIKKNLDKINNYFNNREQATIKEIESELDIEAYKVEPLLKLLGFKCKRRKKKQVWIKATSWKSKKEKG